VPNVYQEVLTVMFGNNMEIIMSKNISMDKNLIGFGRFFYDATERNLHNGSDVILLEPRVGEVLEFLLRTQTAITRDKLIDGVWGLSGSDEALTQAISRLRRALNDTARPYKIIKTIPRSGYKIEVKSSFVDHIPTNHIEGDKQSNNLIKMLKRHRNYLLGILTGLLLAFFGISLWLLAHPLVQENHDVVCFQGSTEPLCQQ